ncbi:MAG: phosphotransferase family protein [Candidatus Heimdallarchaeaceae archaeon]
MPLSMLLISEKLPEYLQDKFPERGKTEVLELTSLAKGWETELFSFVYTYMIDDREIREDLILRIYPGTNTQHKTKREYETLKVLYNAGYPVPKTHILELDTSFLDYSFIIMDRIMGSDMGDDFFKALQNEEYERLQKQIIYPMCSLFVKLHSLDWKILQKSENLNSLENQEKLIFKNLIKYESILERDDLPELSPILDWLKENSNDIKIELAITHGDFHPHNIMISNEGDAFVIDWPAGTVGDYRADLGWTLLLTGAYTSKEIRNMVLNTYESIKGSKVHAIEFFEVLSALRRLMDIMILFKHGAEASGMREEARQQIVDSLPHLNYVISLVKDTTGVIIPEVENFIQSVLKS